MTIETSNATVTDDDNPDDDDDGDGDGVPEGAEEDANEGLKGERMGGGVTGSGGRRSGSGGRSEPFSTFDLWKEYEGVAMHFNDLLIKLRIQALGGVAAVTAIAGTILKEPNESIKWHALGVVLFAIAPLWLGIFFLDYYYYFKLLVGAVTAIKNIETKSPTNSDGLRIDLSTEIEIAVVGVGNKPRFPKGAKAFYAIVFVVLLSLGFICLMETDPGSRQENSPQGKGHQK